MSVKVTDTPLIIKTAQVDMGLHSSSSAVQPFSCRT